MRGSENRGPERPPPRRLTRATRAAAIIAPPESLSSGPPPRLLIPGWTTFASGSPRGPIPRPRRIGRPRAATDYTTGPARAAAHYVFARGFSRWIRDCAREPPGMRGLSRGRKQTAAGSRIVRGGRLFGPSRARGCRRCVLDEGIRWDWV